MKIDKDIPVPAIDKAHWYKYPWTEMEIGDSFFVPYGDATGVKQVSVGTYAGAANHRYPNRRFISRRCIEGGATGYRMWRVK